MPRTEGYTISFVTILWSAATHPFDDQTAFKVGDGKVEVVSEGQWQDKAVA
jgi:hypothetical protein